MNIPLVSGSAYIALMVGLAVGSVGKTTGVNIISWWFPLQLFWFLVIPFSFGYLAGEIERKSGGLR